MTQPDEFIASSLRETADQAASRVRAIDLDVVLAEGSRRARRRSKQRRASATVALVAAIVVVFVVPLPHLWLRRQTTTTTTPTHKVTKSAATVSVARLIAGHWSKMSPAPIAPRAGEAVVWTGQELLVWGGSTTAVGGSKLYGTGAAYDPSTNSWRMLPPAPLSPRTDASAVWTGNEMVIFGGYDYESSIGGTRVTNNAASYDPSTNSWRMLPPAPLSPRAGAIAVWTGKEVIVLGGQPASGAGSDGDGAAFDPTTNTWQHIAAPLPPRGHPLAWQTAVRAGNELIAFSLWWEVHSLGSGGFTVSGGADLFTYDLATGRWRWVPARANALGDPAETLWTGRLLIVRGEPYYCHACKIAEIAPEVTDLYDPARNSWTRIVPDPLAVSV
ncbi:MAG TPA: kelch repeat-containing protein, partial [Acidimicrobiales bacterium]|nr:kelch repeat-containing protein [Acidimicrobiales bacterium]